MQRTMILVLVTIITLIGFAPAGEAQRSLLLRNLKLTEGDLEMLRQAGDRAYESGQPGTAQEWTNDESGNSGVARLVQTFEREGLPCRRIEHLITVEDRADPTQVVFDTCKDSDGVWKLI